jgi:DNA topoisomerase-1
MSSKILVIVESPAKCKKIESYLGANYKVIASYGHLRGIDGLNSIDVTNKFFTKYTVSSEPRKLSQIEKIRTEIALSQEVILATDNDREGEAIAWHICELFGLSVTNTKRIVFREITETAITNAIKTPHNINMNLVHSQQSRQILDLLVGFIISPILWNCISKTHDSSLSAGRCQTPALRLIYDNYLDIKQCAGKFIYNITGYFTNLNLVFELNKQFETPLIVTQFLNECKTWNFIITTTPPKKTIRKSPDPLTTSGLQQLASNELHMAPKDTMKYAQQLYEGGYITYMRTDSLKYSQEFIDNAKNYIVSLYGEQYVSSVVDDLSIDSNNKQTNTNQNVKPQEAHEAIRPVNIHILLNTETDDKLHIKAVKLYELIWKRTLSSCMSSAQYNIITAKITAPLSSDFIYKTEQPIFLGWQITDKLTTTEQRTSVYQYIANLKQHATIKPKKIDAKFNVIDLKTHYSEAHLVRLLEDKGIGRPSTFAALIDKIQERKYVEKQNITGKTLEGIDFSLDAELQNITEINNKKEFGNEKNKLVIQPLGIIVIEFLINKFDEFFNYDYTKEMETDLDKIAQNEMEWYKLCEQCFNKLTNVTNNLKSNKTFNLKIDDTHNLIVGKYGPVIKCVTNDVVSFIPVKKDIDINKLQNVNEPKLLLVDIIDTNKSSKEKIIGKYKGKDLFIKNGKYGLYAQWDKETFALKGEFTFDTIENEYVNILKILDKDMLDPSKPIGFIRELNQYLSIRNGKYGDYIFYKKPRMKTPKFLKLNGFKEDYKKCDKNILLGWIKETHKVE